MNKTKMVFYLKYRPQKIEDLDSREIREKLSSFLSGASVHALLFTGPKGLGKTSAARIVAKAVNCEKNAKRKTQNEKQLTSLKLKRNVQLETQNLTNEQIEPCNKCDQCLSITNGTNLDVLEIDGASNRGIDEIRDLKEKIKLSPMRAGTKVYIIDEVHMLTQEAFDALLKTLEEPPIHAMFILCTTEPHKVPSTIASRCFQLSFKKATGEELVHSLTRISKGEKIAIDKDALLTIASLSDGSFRDGAKILEELVSLSKNKKITKEFVEDKYRITNINYQASLMLRLLALRNLKESLELVSKLVEQGTDIKYFIESLIGKLHGMLLAEAGIKNSEFRIQNSEFSLEEIRRLVELLTKAHRELKYAVLPQLPLELSIIEFCQHSVQKSEVSQDVGRDLNSKLSMDNRDFGVLKDNLLLTKLIEGIKPYNHSVAGVLRSCSAQLKSSNIIIKTKYKFHKEKLEDIKNMSLLEKIARDSFGKKLKVSILLVQ